MKSTLKLTAVELKLFIREPVTVIFTFAFPLFVLIILAGVFGNNPEEGEVEWRGVGPTDYYVPAYVGLVIASIGLIAMPLRLGAYRETGVLRRFRASSLPVWSIFGSQVIGAAIPASIGALTITLAAWLIYDTFLPREGLSFLGGYVLSLLAFAAIGMFLGAVLPTARAAQSVGLVLFFIMMFISGAGPPREVLDSTMHAFSEVLPLTHVILVLQDPWLGYGWHVTSSLVVAAFMVLCTVLAVRLFRWE